MAGAEADSLALSLWGAFSSVGRVSSHDCGSSYQVPILIFTVLSLILQQVLPVKALELRMGFTF